MPNIFEVSKATIYKNGIEYKPGTKTPIGDFKIFAENVPCRLVSITGNVNVGLYLCILKRNVNKLPGFIRKGYKVKFHDTESEYLVENEPVWAGGVQHHLECRLQEYK